MAPRNPSELQRLTEEREALIDAVKNFDTRKAVEFGVADKGLKAGREALLRELRNIEATLGVDSIPYNSEEF